MRDKMPRIAAAVDALRQQWGRENVDQLMRRGMRGEPVFFACENGHTVGTPLVQPRARQAGWMRGDRRGDAPVRDPALAADGEPYLEFGDFMNWDKK